MGFMRLEQLPTMKQEIEKVLEDLIAGVNIEKIDWTVKADIGERKIVVEIMPNFKDVADPTKFGEIGTIGCDTMPEKVKYTNPAEDDIEYPNKS